MSPEDFTDWTDADALLADFDSPELHEDDIPADLTDEIAGDI